MTDTSSAPSSDRTFSNLFARIGVTQMVLVALMVVFIWQWLAGQQAINEMELQLAKKIAEMEGKSNANQNLLNYSQEQVRVLSDKTSYLETRIAELQSERSSIDELYKDLASSRDEMMLAELEQTMLIAEQQLYLSNNVKAALIALQSADARLQRANQPIFNGIRKSINQDIEKLKAVPDVDISGMSFQLENLIDGVDNLPLIQQQRIKPAVSQVVPDANASITERFWHGLWQELRQLVRIQNTGKAEMPLLMPDQEYFLRENIKLQLLSARLALLSRDEETFKHKLAEIKTWSARYFDQGDASVSQAIDALNQLSESTINIELPDISASLASVRTFRMGRDKGSAP